jgi:hypothetical protein
MQQLKRDEFGLTADKIEPVIQTFFGREGRQA